MKLKIQAVLLPMGMAVAFLASWHFIVRATADARFSAKTAGAVQYAWKGP